MTAATRAFLDSSDALGRQVYDAECNVLALAAAARRELETARFASEQDIEDARARNTAGELDDFAAAELIHSLTDRHRDLTDELGVIETEIAGWRRRGRLPDPITVDQILAWVNSGR